MLHFGAEKLALVCGAGGLVAGVGCDRLGASIG